MYMAATYIDHIALGHTALEFEIIFNTFNSARQRDDWVSVDPENRICVSQAVYEKYKLPSDELGIPEFDAKHTRVDWDNLCQEVLGDNVSPGKQTLVEQLGRVDTNEALQR